MQSFATILANVCWKRHKKNLYNEDTFVSSRRYLCFRGGLLNKYHKILTCTPEDLRIGNPQHILFLGILCKGVAARRMCGQYLSGLGVEFYLLVYPYVNLRKVALVEISLQNLAVLQDVLVLQFLLSTEYEPRRIELFILVADGLRLRCALALEVGHRRVKIVHRLVKFSDMNVLCVKFRTKLLKLLVFLIKLLDEVFHCLLQLVTLL